MIRQFVRVREVIDFKSPVRFLCDDSPVQEGKPEPEDTSPTVCLNCGEKLLGAFCWRCGEEAADFHRPLRALASDFLENVLNLDSKLLRTLGPLLFKPGRLTREYLAGRRVSHVRPLKLYLLAALLSFGVLAIWPGSIPRSVLEPVAVMAWLWIFVYLLLALRRVYGGSRLAVGLRFGALLISYGIVFASALVGLMMLTIYRFHD